MKPMLWLVASLALSAGAAVSSLPLQDQQPPTAAAASAPLSSKIWLGRHAEYEAFLRTAEIERTTTVKVGILGIRHAFFKPGGLAAGAAVRDIRPGIYDGHWESYKSEIAAYKLDRLLQLDLVPPTVERRINRVMSSVQLWIENTRMSTEIGPVLPPLSPDSTRQFFHGMVFHNLIGNIDANKGNLLVDGAWNFILVDFSRAFTDTLTQPFELNRVDRSLLDRIKALDSRTLRREIGDLVEFGAIDALLERRDAIVRTFEKLAKDTSENQVFLPER